MAGKGSKLRPGADLKAFRDNYDVIFNREKYTEDFKEWFADLQASKGMTLDKEKCFKIYVREKNAK